MSDTTVRLTIQLTDHNNRRRYTEHHDIPLEQAALKAEEVGGRMAKYMRRERREEKSTKAAGV